MSFFRFPEDHEEEVHSYKEVTANRTVVEI